MRKTLFSEAERRVLREAAVPKDCYYDDGQDRLIKPGDPDWSDAAYRRFWRLRRCSGVTESQATDDLANALIWYARAVNKTRVWSAAIKRHSQVDITKRSWRDWMSVENNSIPYWEWVGYTLSSEQEALTSSTIRTIARDFVKRAGLTQGRTADDAIKAILTSWKQVRGPH